MTDDDKAKLVRYQRLSSVFTPEAPISNRDLFAGRLEQVLQVTSAAALCCSLAISDGLTSEAYREELFG